MTKAQQVEEAVLRLLRAHRTAGALPTTVRFLFYELEQQGFAMKPDPKDPRRFRRRSVGMPAGEQDIIDAVTRLRKRGVVPWEWLADEERTLYVPLAYETVIDGLIADLDTIDLDPWLHLPAPLILTESKGMAAVLRGTAFRYACPISGLKGQSAGHLRTRILPHLNATGCREVIYLGDLDKPGRDIEDNARTVLEEALIETLDWHRVAVLPDQTKDMTPIAKVDGRTGRVWTDCYEVEALGQQEVIRLLTARLDSLLPRPIEESLSRAQSQREALKPALDDLRDLLEEVG